MTTHSLPQPLITIMAYNPEKAKKEIDQYRTEAGDKINPLTTEAYFHDQQEIERTLVRSEKGLGEYQRHQHLLESLRKDLVEVMSEQAEGRRSKKAVPRTPENILAEIKQREEDWTRMRGMEDAGIRSLESTINEFCNRYELPVQFDGSVSAETMWDRIQEAYEAKMWRTTNNLPEKHTLGK